jgi:hypothetical protein
MLAMQRFPAIMHTSINPCTHHQIQISAPNPANASSSTCNGYSLYWHVHLLTSCHNRISSTKDLRTPRQEQAETRTRWKKSVIESGLLCYNVQCLPQHKHVNTNCNHYTSKDTPTKLSQTEHPMSTSQLSEVAKLQTEEHTGNPCTHQEHAMHQLQIQPTCPIQHLMCTGVRNAIFSSHWMNDH